MPSGQEATEELAPTGWLSLELDQIELAAKVGFVQADHQLSHGQGVSYMKVSWRTGSLRAEAHAGKQALASWAKAINDRVATTAHTTNPLTKPIHYPPLLQSHETAPCRPRLGIRRSLGAPEPSSYVSSRR